MLSLGLRWHPQECEKSGADRWLVSSRQEWSRDRGFEMMFQIDDRFLYFSSGFPLTLLSCLTRYGALMIIIQSLWRLRFDPTLRLANNAYTSLRGSMLT